MKNNYFKRIVINGDVKNLPKEKAVYLFTRHEGFNLFKHYDPEVSDKSEFVKLFKDVLIPVPSPDVIVGPSEEDLKEMLRKSSMHFTVIELEIITHLVYKWYRSQLKTVNLKDEIEKIRQKALTIQEDWQYPNEVYIECTGAIMACNELLENLSKDNHQSKNK